MSLTHASSTVASTDDLYLYLYLQTVSIIAITTTCTVSHRGCHVRILVTVGQGIMEYFVILQNCKTFKMQTQVKNILTFNCFKY